MKENELRIGNLVTDSIGIVEIGENAKIEFCDIYNPIPLTEEWLLRFGFVFDDEYDWYVLDCDNGVSLSHIINGLTHYFGNLECFWVDVLQEIKYVHTLQNLYFALTGEELTLKE